MACSTDVVLEGNEAITIITFHCIDYIEPQDQNQYHINMLQHEICSVTFLSMYELGTRDIGMYIPPSTYGLLWYHNVDTQYLFQSVIQLFNVINRYHHHYHHHHHHHYHHHHHHHHHYYNYQHHYYYHYNIIIIIILIIIIFPSHDPTMCCFSMQHAISS